MTAGVTVKGYGVRLNVTIRELNRARYRHFRRLKTISDVLLPVKELDNAQRTINESNERGHSFSQIERKP